MNAPLQITLVDDSDLAQAGFAKLLEPYAERVVVLDYRDAIARPAELDAVLYEPMGQSSMSASLLRDLQTAGHAQAAVYTWAGRDQLPAQPANPLLSKSLTASQLVVSVEKLVDGRFEEPAQRAEVPVVAMASGAEAAGEIVEAEAVTFVDDAGLTPREADIVALIVAGHSNREIGEELQLSINSVKTYIRSAYRKMGVERRTQAVLWGLARGLGADPSAEALVS
ncbi:response regulator transcription factor [Nocardioides sp. R-C-SC26]|uniref:response regulator transcription factor n=1 Tax=Nocardioides sp. R-C-SC26 TaxID=2870414 RepID=UPI001E2E0FDD|nr:response regulator transcription factor [Nocardioides sp. R-C-SC26]